MTIIELDIHSDSLPNIKPNQVFQFKINDLNNDHLKKFALELEQTEEKWAIRYSNIGGWHSQIHLFKTYKNESLNALQESILTCTEKILNRKPTIVSSWININRKGNRNKSHMHECPLAACYYIASEDNHGGEFFMTGTPIKFTPEIGTLLIFPGNAYHEVLPYEGDKVRISLACNIK